LRTRYPLVNALLRELSLTDAGTAVHRRRPLRRA
jgi:hypothetical protein